jgi:hypothetical protein
VAGLQGQEIRTECIVRRLIKVMKQVNDMHIRKACLNVRWRIYLAGTIPMEPSST